MAVKNFPCKNCPNRMAGCHSHCEDYNMAKSVYEKDKAEERLHKDINNFIIQSTLDRTGYYKKKNRRIYIHKDYMD